MHYRKWSMSASFPLTLTRFRSKVSPPKEEPWLLEVMDQLVDRTEFLYEFAIPLRISKPTRESAYQSSAASDQSWISGEILFIPSKTPLILVLLLDRAIRFCLVVG